MEAKTIFMNKITEWTLQPVILTNKRERKGENEVFKSKFFELAIALFMIYFAYTRFVLEQYIVGGLFTVLALLNLVVFSVKLKQERNEKTK